MSTNQKVQQLQQELQNALTTSNQLLRLISIELQKIKRITNPGEDLDTTIKKNALLLRRLANMQQIDIDNLPRLPRLHNNFNSQPSHNE